MQATYRKKPFRITAFRVDDIGEAVKWIKEQGGSAQKSQEFGIVITLEGAMMFGEGDYIIRGIEGELYPCRGGIFERTYELVEEG
jgi:hypothetical protein